MVTSLNIEINKNGKLKFGMQQIKKHKYIKIGSEIYKELSVYTYRSKSDC